MSILFMDDPSFYSTAQMTTRWTSMLDVVVSAGNGRFGTASWRYSGTAYFQRQQLPSSIATGTVGVSFKIPSTQTAGILIVFWDSGSKQCDVRFNGAGQLQVTRNGTNIGSASSQVVQAGVWYRLEFKLTVNSTTGSIEVKMNGVDWIGPTSSLNTQATSNATFNQVGIGDDATNFSSSGIDFSDFVCTDTNSPNANFLGDVRCYLRMPSSDSSVTWTQNFGAWPVSTVVAAGYTIKDSNNNVQMVTVGGTTGSGSHPTWSTTGGATTTDNTVTWTCLGTGSNPGAHNWMAVQETPASDGDESYNSSSTPTQIDLLGLPSLPSGAQGVLAVDSIIYVRKDDAGTRTVQQQISSGGTTRNSASLALSTSFQYQDFINETDPNTSAAWTVSAANAMLTGYDEIA